jgi:hypothetical protein
VNLEDAKTIGIIGGLVASSIGLFLNFYSTLRSIRSQKISNYQEIVKSHREIWKLTIDKPDPYARVLRLDVNIVQEPITYTEKLFTRLLFLHMSSTHSFAKHSNMMPIEKLELDFCEILLNPIPRMMWNENRKYYNRDFVQFVENCGKEKGIFARLKGLIVIRPKYFVPWRVLVLSAYSDRLTGIIEALGDEVIVKTDQDPEITRAFIRTTKIDFIVCFGYGKIIKPEVIRTVTCINIHTGYLPFNRGPNPHLWAWLDGTPKGITIHYIDKGIDTGDIIAQKQIEVPESLTFQLSYDKHVDEAIELFKSEWNKIRAGLAARMPQKGTVTQHTLKSQKAMESLFQNGGLDLPVTEFSKKAKELLNQPVKVI